MKKVLVFSAILVLLLASLVPVSLAAAQSDVSPTPIRPKLGINGPAVVTTGEQFKVQVVALPGGAPVSRAGVWAVNFANVGVPTADVLSAASGLEMFLGWTDNNGVLVYAFKTAGFFFLVTFKDGCDPGFSSISVKAGQAALGIRVPESAQAGEVVTALVYDRNSGAGVPQAGLWAVSANLSVSPTANSLDAAALVKQYGQFLGNTDSNGKLAFKLENPNRYLLVAVKDAYLPGFGKINILPAKKALIIRAPTSVKVLETFPLRVVERSVMPVEIPVPKAGVWAISVNDVASLEADAFDPAIAQKYGQFLGWTDEQGYLNPKPSIAKTGKFWLVAIKDGYIPGVTTIAVLPLIEATPTPLPASPAGVIAIK